MESMFVLLLHLSRGAPACTMVDASGLRIYSGAKKLDAEFFSTPVEKV
jgi:hypothetical protein